MVIVNGWNENVTVWLTGENISVISEHLNLCSFFILNQYGNSEWLKWKRRCLTNWWKYFSDFRAHLNLCYFLSLPFYRVNERLKWKDIAVWKHFIDFSRQISPSFPAYCYLYTESVATLFRGASLATALMDRYMRTSAHKFVQVAVQEPINKILDCKSCEVSIVYRSKVISFCVYFQMLSVLSKYVLYSLW